MSHSLSIQGTGSEERPENASGQEAAVPPAGDREAVQWEVVARTGGITAASILVGRLQAEGIPSRCWQEGAGQAFGLTVGILGTGYVAVPEEFAEAALAILNDEPMGDEEE